MAHQATYSPEDNKLRMYPEYRLPKDEYLRLKKAGFKWAPKQELFVAPKWTPEREDILIEFCGKIGDEDTSLVDRAEERAGRFDEYSQKRKVEANSAKDGVKAITDHIPFGQPILVGHHSEKRARKDAERIERGMQKAVRLWETAEYWKYRAAGALRHAKYKERPDVRARRIKKIAAEIRKHKASYTPKNPNQTINQKPWLCPVCREYSCKEHPEAKEEIPHVYCGQARGGSWVPVERLESIKQYYSRWIEHNENRLVYEKAMLGEQGASDLLKPKPRPKQLPILNYRAPEGITITNPAYYASKTTTYTQIEITKADYKKIPRDYKGCRKVNGTHRIKVCMGHYAPGYLDGLTGLDRTNKGHSYVAVFLTDSKVHKKPEPVEHKPLVSDQLTLSDVSVPKYTPPERTEFDDMKDILREGVKTISAPQLFVTPPELAEKMVEIANIEPHHRVLEPSAGTGNILKAIGNKPDKVAVEINYDLVTSLMRCGVSGLHVHHDDFLECNGDLGKFEKIIMNPPFKNGVDINHIKHAISFLTPGGRLVALCANGPRQQKELRPIAENSGGYWKDLPQGTFKNSGTMVNAALVVIEG